MGMNKQWEALDALTVEFINNITNGTVRLILSLFSEFIDPVDMNSHVLIQCLL